MADNEAPVYEARYGWDRRTVGILALCAVFTAALLLPDIPLFARILGLPLFGGGGLFMAFGALSRKVAFRVDGTGVLLGGSPVRYGATTVHVPWSDITGFVFWRQQTGGGSSLRYVGVTRREGAPPLAGDGPAAHAVLRQLVPVPPGVAVSSRAVNGWRLDRDRFAAVVAHHAPGLPVYDQS
ncbi:hypothetical protein F8R89_32825 [Streptomyces sp. SS1-1]|uniref:hypothetical protein n=1 Tax=unclassified Streptomyces TaxID=2593676 RepID=UPI0012501BD7|nr:MULTISPECIES: hypothetical protein [unclassified Streptomyces]KAB2976373.1 hypothetical protein F8R89_32825 [Streptomyces sp. SS1-1]MDI9835625.1 hypothetical protein [Streptomyces sp. KAU_LT]